MTINWTWPGRAHLIVGGETVQLYLTVWLFKRRFHYCRLRDEA